MAKKKALLLLSAVLAVSCLTGCARQELTEGTDLKQMEETGTEQMEETIVSVTENLSVDGKTLVIDTEVTVPDLSQMEEVTLCFDEALLDKMVEELVHTQYPGLEEHLMDGDRKWSVATEEHLQFSLGFTDSGFEAGRTYYLDVLRDLNGQNMGDDGHMCWTPYYMTEHIPDKLNMTSTEAAEKLAAFLEQYSCFDYEPWNVVAVNCRNVPDSSGYYQAMMQPQYDGRPVLIDGVPYVSACLSAEGVFTFQGMMVLKEQSRNPAEVTMTLEDAVEQFREDVLADSRDGEVTVDSIKVGYVAESYYDETRVLTPAWIFEYSAVRPHLNTGEEWTQYYTSAYRMENGEPLEFW